jgi:thymidylate synthase ThyX
LSEADFSDPSTVRVLDHGFVRLDGAMADDLSVVNGARVSFARRKTEMDDADEGLIRFLMRDRHGSPFEHNAFRFHIRCPIFVAREWFRHRIGCLTGDTEVTFVNVNGQAHMRKTIDEIVHMWNVGQRDGHALDAAQRESVRRLASAGRSQRSIARELRIGRRAVRTCLAGAEGMRSATTRLRKMRVRVLDESTNEFTTGHICDVIEKGVQPVYRLTLADGKEITMTENHRVLTADGWARMRDAIGLAGDGDAARMTRECRLVVNGVPAHQDPTWLRRRREAGRSVAFMHRFADRIGTIHDIDVPSRRGWKLMGHPVRVVAVAYVGLRQTYDLSIDGPWHNFVANGIVVHNSFNEFSMRYAKATDDFYLPEPDDVRTQVGKPGAYTFEAVDAELAEETRQELKGVYEEAYATYTRLVEKGVARELARSVIPVGAYTQFYWTVNARALMNFLSLRNAEFAQLEIRRYAEAAETFFAERMPLTHAAFVANDRTAP